MHTTTATRGHGIRSTALVLLALLVFLAPNGMNRAVIPDASVDPMVLIARAAMRITPLPFGTRVAARCVAPSGRVTYIDPDERCASGAARSEVFVLPQENVADGMPPEERSRALRAPAAAASGTNAQQCAGLDDLLRVIDDEVQRPWPVARQDELRQMRDKARKERERLLC